MHISCACFLDCAEKGRGKRGAVALFHLGVSTVNPSGIQTAKQIAFRAFNKSEDTFLTAFHCANLTPRKMRRQNKKKSKTAKTVTERRLYSGSFVWGVKNEN